MEIEFLENNEEITKRIIERLALTFDEMIKINKVEYKDNVYFIEERIPEISIKKYLLRLNKYLCPSYSLFIILPYIMDKIILNKEYNIILNEYIVHYIILTSILLVSKQYEDTVYTNKFYSEIGGLSLKKLNEYEILALKIINYDLSISDELYNDYKNNLLKNK